MCKLRIRSRGWPLSKVFFLFSRRGREGKALYSLLFPPPSSSLRHSKNENGDFRSRDDSEICDTSSVKLSSVAYMSFLISRLLTEESNNINVKIQTSPQKNCLTCDT